MKAQATPAPSIIVVFGVTGDLASRKLLPALTRLLELGLLNEQTVIVGITRQAVTTDQILANYQKSAKSVGAKELALLKKVLIVKSMDITEPSAYVELLSFLNQIEDDHKTCMNRLYYLAIPPQVYSPIIKLLGEHGLNKSCQHNRAVTRLLVEKPFGYDGRSSSQLINDTAKYFSEDQTFRIDHYLAKETVQNILAFRFNNAIFESLWDHKYVASICVSLNELIGIEGRDVFYEQTGALRDVVQSHLLQLLAVVTMEQPKSLSSADIHKSKLDLLKSIESIKVNKVYEAAIRGQYDTYRAEVKNNKSNVETYAAIKLNINNRRWSGVPIILQTGKNLSDKKADIKIVFRRTSQKLTRANSLTFRIQPNEGIDLQLFVKKPGLDNQLEKADMDFSYSRFFPGFDQIDAYDRVLIDALRGDQTLFATSDEIDEAWRIVDPILDVWSRDGQYLHFYKANSSEPTKLLDWLVSTGP